VWSSLASWEPAEHLHSANAAAAVAATECASAAAVAAGNYLAMVQHREGYWADQYSGSSPVSNGHSTRNLVQPMMLLAALQAHGLADYTATLQRASACLVSRLDDSGLIHDGHDNTFWLSDNAYAVVVWHRLGEAAKRDAAVNAINTHFLDNDCWHHHLSSDFSPRQGPFGWIHFAPAMLDLRAFGVAYPGPLAQRMRRSLQVSSGVDSGAVLDQEGSSKRMPGIGFQASLAWRDLGADSAGAFHRRWCESRSGLWQKMPDANGISGGWIDWKDASGRTAAPHERFIDTSAYYIMYTHGFRFHNGINEPIARSFAPLVRMPWKLPFKLPWKHGLFELPTSRLQTTSVRRNSDVQKSGQVKPLVHAMFTPMFCVVFILLVATMVAFVLRLAQAKLANAYAARKKAASETNSLMDT